MYTHLEQRDSTRPPVSLGTLDRMKREHEKIACITCYDASFAVLCDNADTDLVLVGDSLGMVLQGHDTTVPVTMDDIVYHCKAVARGLHRPFLVADLPFASYPTSDIALANSVRLMQEGGAEMVKLESGLGQLEIVEFLARHDIAVCAHLGLKPQSVHKTGGFKVQGRDEASAKRMLDSAKALESAGADIVLLECIPSELGKKITEALEVPVIGIGAGPDTDGQILVLYDVLDITSGRKPRFVKNFMDGASSNVDALKRYVEAVKKKTYPRPSTNSMLEARRESRMLTVTTIAAVRAQVAQWRAAGERVVFVPTMGNLHAGHVSLIEAARRHGKRFVASIFVNPMQFGPNEDFAHYPRTPTQDAKMLGEAGCDLMFMPEVGEIYPNGADQATRVEVPGISNILCGEFRPGHFEGVATVVCKLFNIVDADVAIFGEKDFQQLTVIRRMVADLCLRVEIVGAPTVREPDGLAMSSRNQYLDEAQRKLAPAIYRQLQQAVAALQSGVRDYARIDAAGRAALDGAGFRTDYFSVRDAKSLARALPDTRQFVVMTASRLGKARLIDNIQYTVS